MSKRVILIGDLGGITTILEEANPKNIVGIIAAIRRPQYLDDIRNLCEKLGVPLIVQPFKKNQKLYTEFLHQIKLLNPDLVFCYSYSMKIPSEIITLVNGLAYNLHESYLPYNKGPNSENWALINGHEFSGSTIHLMDENFDTGDILFREKVEISIEDTWATLLKKTSKAARKLIKDRFNQIINGDYKPVAQDKNIASKNFRLNEEYPKIVFSQMTDFQIFNLIRAQVSPLKGAFIEFNNQRIYFNQYMTMEQVKELRNQYGNN